MPTDDENTIRRTIALESGAVGECAEVVADGDAGVCMISPACLMLMPDTGCARSAAGVRCS
ncbi:Siroheme synthase (fragment) [Paraburkholderia dioscoreae]|uniref:Siroheme synthase n=1 Tax=Paraburkholderia dioscoreae TaxID=2604047 RepID=A0A5Q4YW92_9BURK